MLVSDRSAILKRMWKEPAANADFIIALSSDSAIYASSLEGAGGFVVVDNNLGSGWAWMNALSVDEVVSLLREPKVADSRWLAVTSATIADVVCQAHGFRLSRRSRTYSAEESTVPTFDRAGVVKNLTSGSAGKVLEFANAEADDHPSWELNDNASVCRTVACYAEDGDNVVGYADSVVHPGPLREIGYVFVKPEARGKGYGKMLVSAVTKRILAAGGIPLYIVDADNHVSIRTCASVGYRLCRELWILEKE